MWGEDAALKLGWFVATLCLIALFAFALWLGVWGYAPLKSRPLPLKDALGPGPGFFPLWLSLIGLSLCALLLIEVLRQPGRAVGEASLIPDGGACFRILTVVLLLAAAALSLDPLGFRLTAFGFTLLALLALGTRSLVAIPVFTLAASIGVFHVFYHWLKVPLPIGPFDHVLKPLGL